MGATQHVRKWGSSLAVRIPKAIAEQWGVSEGLRHRNGVTGRSGGDAKEGL